MSEVDIPPLHHEVRYEREVMDLPPNNGWRERVPTPNARTSCTCGLDTGYVDADEAYRAAQEHVKRELPGVDWGPDVEGPVRPGEEPTT